MLRHDGSQTQPRKSRHDGNRCSLDDNNLVDNRASKGSQTAIRAEWYFLKVKSNPQAARSYSNLAATVYQLDKPVGRSFGDVELYAQLLSGVSGTIFEPAAGNGRALIPLAMRGYKVEGSEPSEEMRSLLKENARRSDVTIPIDNGLMTDFNTEEDYAAIIIPAGSIQLLRSSQQVRHTFERAHKGIRTGGRLVFDIDALSGLFANASVARSWTLGNELLTLTEEIEMIDSSSQTRTTHLRYERWKNDRLAEAQIDRFTLRFWGIQEMCNLLELCGFNNVRLHSDYSLNEPISKSTSVTTLVATK